jgi:uncharacterized protein YqeY
MALVDRINEDIKDAMRSKDQVRLTSLRAVKSQLLLAATEKGATGEVSDEAGMKLLQRLVKQRKESADIFTQQGRADLAANEQAEAAIIEAYLPKQLGEDELRPIIAAIISEVGASGPQDMGKVMGTATKRLAGQADGKVVSAVVKALLG